MDWNPCASAPRTWFKQPRICGCCSPPGWSIQTRSVFMRAYPRGWMDYLPYDDPLRFFAVQTSSLVFHSNHGPYNGSGSWDAEENFDGTFDQWGNLNIDANWTEEWHDSFFSPPSDPRNRYTSATTIDADGCMSGNETGYKDVASLRARYDCPTGAGCTYHAATTTKTNIDESDACTPTSGPGAIWTFERHLELTEERLPADSIATIDSLLPDVTTLPWGASQSGVVRRFKPESACAYPGVWEDTSALDDELAALADYASSAAADVATAESALADAEDALSDYLTEWSTKHSAWQAEKTARCNGAGELTEEEWADLEGFVFSLKASKESYTSTVAGAKLALDDAQAYQAVAYFHVAQKEEQIASVVAGKWQGYLESGYGGGYDLTDETAWPAWVDKGHAQARVRVQINYPARGPVVSGSPTGEDFEVKIGSLHTFTVHLAPGEYFGYTEAYTYTEAAAAAYITIRNVTAYP